MADLPDLATRFSAAAACIDPDRLGRTLLELVSAHSPTGAEWPAAKVIGGIFEAAGITPQFQHVGENSANVFVRLPGTGDGPSLLLYAPIDTHIEAYAAQDIPLVGASFRPDMLPVGHERDGFIVGLGAANPKGMAATILESALALHSAKLPLRGDVIVAFAGGGMPINASQRGNRGLSDGVYHMLTRGVCADFAIVMKPGTGVYHEEPGLCWFRVSVRGQFGYAGIPRGIMPNAIPPAAKLILELEEWLPTYTAKNTRGQVTPRGAITALRAGSPDRLAFTPATTEIYLDIRCAPHTPPAEVKAQFGEALAAIGARNSDIKFDWEMCAAYPGSATPADNWIIQSAIRGWEAVEGTTHTTPPNSGQTDISLIRNLGIPTARLGWPSTPKNVPADLTGGLGGMGVASIPDLAIACRKILHATIDTCARRRSEVGL